MITEPKRFYSATELAHEFGVSRTAIFKRIQSGKIRATKVGRNYIIAADEVASLMGQLITPERKAEIEDAVKRVTGQYKETLRRLGQE